LIIHANKLLVCATSAFQFGWPRKLLTKDVLRSNLRHLWDYENDEIDHKSKKPRPQSGFRSCAFRAERARERFE
jgi:hypothetical protein